MKVNGISYRTIWEEPQNSCVIQIIDQNLLPHVFKIVELTKTDDFVRAINNMQVRGAPLIGVTAAYGMYMAVLEAQKSGNFDQYIQDTAEKLIATRPTAINLKWAINKQLDVINQTGGIKNKIEASLIIARNIADTDVENCRSIGEYGAKLIEEIAGKKKSETVNILTHCNAGWLATVDWGTATAPIYVANEKGIKIHVWVDETRPRNQGAKLTSWELNNEGIENKVIVDNAGGHLMQKGMVDLVIVGSDRTTYTGDVANKIGTYLKALAAYDNNIPFYVALPASTIDWDIEDGMNMIPIEERDADEVRYVDGLCDGEIKKVLVPHENSKAANYAFDVTPGHLVTGLITERGICKANKDSIFSLFPEKRKWTTKDI
jgi:methylthioribose-1-phosphate isomerase